MALPDILSPYTRRGFLRQTFRAGVGLSAASVLRDLRLISTASAQSGPPDYKALVCIFLAGGNDSDNTIVDLASVPWDHYDSIRGGLRIPHPTASVPQDEKLVAINLLRGETTTQDAYGLHPALKTVRNGAEVGIRKLLTEGRAAVVFNVGPLVRPITRAEYDALSPDLPPQLFSHQDQAIHWQTSLPDKPTSTGWAGRMADLLNDGIPTYNSGKVSMNTSIAGTNMFQTGAAFNQFHVSTRGAVVLDSSLGGAFEWFGGWHRGVKNVAEATAGNSNLQRAAYAGVLNSALATGDYLNGAMARVVLPPGKNWDTLFPTTSLGNQLKTVARMIAARGAVAQNPQGEEIGGLGMNRQTFFVQAGGYDTHGDQVHDGAPHSGFHAGLLKDLSEAVHAFQTAMADIGTEDNVVSFTASDFGRTFRSNGLGSDHGWGGHHFVFGGPNVLRGGRTFGERPNLDLSDDLNPDDGGAGRWIPKISVDEYSATLAKWFGAGSYLDTVFPNLGNMNTDGIPFLNL